MPTDLISRLSAGRFPGDNAEVLEFLGWSEISTGTQDGFFSLWRCDDRQEMGLLPLDSLDDALRLVPDGWRTDGVYQSMDGDYWVWPLLNITAHNKDDYLGASAWVTGEAPTAAVALTIAILRAKEADRG